MYIKGKCKKCGQVIVLDIGEAPKAYVQEWIRLNPARECPGGHMEVGTYSQHYDFNWNTLYTTKEEAFKDKENTNVNK